MQFIDLKTQQKKIIKNLDKSIRAVLDHGQFILGPEVKKLEELLAKDAGVRHCVTCSSGTDALLILLMAKNIGPGDAIITTPFTYIATAEVIALLGATPIFVDIYEKTFNIDPSKIEKGINFGMKKGLSVKGIISVDLFGLPARYRMIQKIAKENNLFLIEDSAQGYGGKIIVKKACSFGDAAATSFFPTKPLSCYGDGGAIFTNDDKLLELVKSIRVHGQGINKYDNVRTGINGRLDTIQAAILIEKLKIFNDEIILRNKVAEYYNKTISKSFIKQYIPKNYKSAWAQFSILAPEKLERELVIQSLKDNGIPSMVYYPTPLHQQRVFKPLGYRTGSFPIAEYISSKIFSIPMHPYLNDNQMKMIVDILNSL